MGSPTTRSAPGPLAVESLISDDGAVHGPGGIVYSTTPHIGTTRNGTVVYVKGPELETVFAEVVGCLLARAVGLNVPRTLLCTDDDGNVFAGSVQAATVGRNVIPWLSNRDRCSNHQELFAAIAVDAWLANTDRNLGNVLVSRDGDGKDCFVFIDFEKSTALRPYPTIKLPDLQPAAFWPRELLGQHLKDIKPLWPPSTMLASITNLARDPVRVKEIVGAVAAHLAVDWAESTIHAVIDRGLRISTIASEVWQQS